MHFDGHWTIFIRNKKVLLREHERHTDRGISSTPYVLPGVPPRLDLVGIPPIQVQTGVPHLWAGGYPPIQTRPGYSPTPICTPSLGGRYPGVPPCPDMTGVPSSKPGWGYPPLGVDWQTKWKYNLPSRTMYLVGNNKFLTSATLCKLLRSFAMPNLRKWRLRLISMESLVIFVLWLLINWFVNVTKTSIDFLKI